MNDLEARLADLGEHLVLDDAPLADDVLARLDGDVLGAGRGSGAGWLRAAAIVLALAAAVLVAVPDSRRAIADWLGLRGVQIDRVPSLTVPGTAPDVGVADPIGDAEVVEVDGVAVMVSVIDGSFEPELLTKTVATDNEVLAVEVGDMPGVWIGGAPHLVAYRSVDGTASTVRVAGNTLLWQDGDRIRRVEGFASLDDALAYALDG